MVVHTLSLPEPTAADVDRVFAALAHATRRDIVDRVLQQEQSVSELAERYAMTFAAVQKHVAVLERASLITKHRRGREQLVYGNPDMLRLATRLLGRYEELWSQRATSIASILAEDSTPPTASPESPAGKPTEK